jgi:hypothetical protein
VICQDEMSESVDAESFQQRLWEMFHIGALPGPPEPAADRPHPLASVSRDPPAGPRAGLFDEKELERRDRRI